ncbi:uncharacterized protein PHACADRAFT_94848 [Phanerochaete carnosa HHB-10118-sp]|uniref:CTLH domain-containing protein n=1 Tax=Phanerochaete carnosa (strain HHB-10118-sp) TaxID=650164 RepID=K5W7A6_PHACS|nr:uncharacterized protein PHACADRAFT_94848 [Phanerochaete carnosa HHB-10118-sp]EKM55055.1 hypothetical protein PHACADRAFT_94848 [Phanerochaete carnosa HHB-10118-sp]
MRLTSNDADSTLSVSPDALPEAGPSTPALSNGHNGVFKGNGFTAPFMNGNGKAPLTDGHRAEKHPQSVARVSLPGTTLYDDSHVDREEFVRLVIQSLRDVGYIESAATLEAESGYTMETSDVSRFRQCILEGDWDSAEDTLLRLGLSEEEGLWEAKFLISQQKYLELLEARETASALHILRNELAPSSPDPEQLHALARRNVSFPRVTTAILQVHNDEVWNLQWSHSGGYLATASRDKSAIIWRIGSDADPSTREYHAQFILRDHKYPVGCVAWSLDDSVLLTASENYIHMWNTRTGALIRVLDAHFDVVTALAWLPDGSGFISGGLDRRIILWDIDGKQRDTWGRTPIRVTDLAITPDFSKLVAIGMYDTPLPLPPAGGVAPTSDGASGGTATPPAGSTAPTPANRPTENRIIVYDLLTKQLETSVKMEGELTSVKVSQNSRYVLINRALDSLGLHAISTGRTVRKYTGHRQSRHVIRSGFGGVDGNFIISGSEDGNVYIWHRGSGTLLETLPGHGNGSVNSVAWNPANPRMFATCSDDHTIRIWEANPVWTVGSSALAEVSDSLERDGGGKGKGKGREWVGDGLGGASGFGIAGTSRSL